MSWRQCLVLVFGWALPSWAQTTVSFQQGVLPSAGYQGVSHGELRAASPNQNDPSSLVVSNDNGIGVRHGLIRWDLTSVPTNSVVQNARLRFYVDNGTVENSYYFYALKRSWDAASATWNRAQTGVSWEVAGALGSMDRDQVLLGNLGPAGVELTYVDLNPSGLCQVETWIQDPASNFGFLIINQLGAEAASLGTNFRAVTANRPMLELTYAPAGGAPSACAAPDGGGENGPSDAGGANDAGQGPQDAGAGDAGPTPDSGNGDSGVIDAGGGDSGFVSDGGTTDGGATQQPGVDGGAPLADAGAASDAGPALSPDASDLGDGGAQGGSANGDLTHRHLEVGCTTGAGSGVFGGLLLVVLLGRVFGLRRRR